MHIILIPAYEPHERLISLIKDIQKYHNYPIIVINDGSNASYDHIFDSIKNDQVHVLKHTTNMGKGHAIKTGLKYIKEQFTDVTHILTCDADGQHAPKDIFHMLESINVYPNHLILGTRDYHDKNMPFKSKLGNQFSSFFFYLNTGKRCHDTQTGLRVIPSDLFSLALSIKDDRFDYEMTFLTSVARASYPIIGIDIDTIYLDHNKASHFRPIRDSMLVYKEPLKFTTIAITSAMIDIGLFTLLIFIFQGTILEIVSYATITARIISGGYNFLLNRIWSFQSKSHVKKDAFRYIILYLSQLALSILFVTLLSYVLKNLTINKMMVDSLLFIMSYYIQKHWVFKKDIIL
ncbi:MAG: family 2 glycosyl transferase [Tenericutes bacterium HGW-Tenericutes-6]|nr:MAG: family 2 glycosyl transferase [Tenericutes bacterium HGW-Tenericutes-6]